MTRRVKAPRRKALLDRLMVDYMMATNPKFQSMFRRADERGQQLIVNTLASARRAAGYFLDELEAEE